MDFLANALHEYSTMNVKANLLDDGIGRYFGISRHDDRRSMIRKMKSRSPVRSWDRELDRVHSLVVPRQRARPVSLRHPPGADSLGGRRPPVGSL